MSDISKMSADEMYDLFFGDHKPVCPRCGTENIAREIYMGVWSCVCRECVAVCWNERLSQEENN